MCLRSDLLWIPSAPDSLQAHGVLDGRQSTGGPSTGIQASVESGCVQEARGARKRTIARTCSTARSAARRCLWHQSTPTPQRRAHVHAAVA